MEVALIPGVLALGESIACQLGYAVAEHQTNTSRSQQGSCTTARSHPGIYSSNNSNANPTRTHSGIYCNPSSQRSLPTVDESQLYHSDISTSSTLDDANSPPLSSRSSCESEVVSPCPTARLMMPNQFCPELGCDPSHSPSTRDLLAPTEEKLCPPRSGSPFGMPSPTGELLAKSQITSKKISAKCGYLLSFEDLSAKDAYCGSNSTGSTCSDLDISFSTMSAASSSASNASEQVTLEDASPGSEIVVKMPVGASPIDQTIVVAPAVPVSKARSFCQKAFAECKLDNLDDELADVTKELEALRSSMARSRNVLCA